MEKICWANTDNFDEAKIVIIGIPDESHSHSLRKGTSEAPDRIRQISNIRDSYIRNGVKTLGLPISGLNKTKVFDYGNISRDQIDAILQKIILQSKIPFVIGGDHSITTSLIKSISNSKGPLSLVYFDAHPDFISSTTNYYGSIIHDALPFIDINSSVLIGIRTPEQEEIDNIKKTNIKTISPFEIVENGLKQTSNSILDLLGKNVYVSFDMDCIDPAFAPGVSVPVPMGIKNTEATYLLKKIIQKGILGMDLMEVCPEYDIKDRTSHLASRMIAESISSI